MFGRRRHRGEEHPVPAHTDRCPDCGSAPVACAYEQAPFTRLMCGCGWSMTVSMQTVRPNPDDQKTAKETQ